MEIKIDHPVQLIPAARAESCWAAAASMLYGGGRPLAASHARESAERIGDTLASALHAGPSTLAQFALQWELVTVHPHAWTLHALADLLARRPLWAGAYRPNGHAMVLSGMLGDGSDGGTFLTVLDPWPPATGAVHHLPFSVWQTRYSLPSMYVLHRPMLPPPPDPLAAIKSLVGKDWDDE